MPMTKTIRRGKVATRDFGANDVFIPKTNVPKNKSSSLLLFFFTGLEARPLLIQVYFFVYMCLSFIFADAALGGFPSTGARVKIATAPATARRTFMCPHSHDKTVRAS